MGPLPASSQASLCFSIVCSMRHLSMGSHERDTLRGRAGEVSQTNLLSRVWNLTGLSVFCKYFLTWQLLQPDPKLRGQEEGQGALTGSPNTTCPQPLHWLARSWNSADSGPSLGKLFQGGHCNREPPSRCSENLLPQPSELTAIKQDSAFRVGDHISLNKLFLSHLFFPHWTRKSDFGGRLTRGSELSERYYLCLLIKMQRVKKRHQDPYHQMHSYIYRHPFTQIGSICVPTCFCHFHLEKRTHTSKAGL